uniref:Ig-like domain-containing protein n=1 Tax=Paramormyrops kingsleyae TaxID=1676925 RepID=A0A3B3RMN9_9TELE
ERPSLNREGGLRHNLSSTYNAYSNFMSAIPVVGCVTLPVLVPERLVVTGADEPVSAHAGEDVTLSCSVDTHVNVTELQVEWRKTDGDIMVLLFTDGENKPDSQHDRYSGRAEFLAEEIPKGNFSMKLSKVRLEDKGEFRCEVHSDTDSNMKRCGQHLHRRAVG